MLVLDVTLSWASFLLLILEVIMIKPSLDSVKALASGYDIVPVYMEILSDIRTPISVLKALKQVSSHTYLLESADNSNHWGRYSFLGYDPKLEIFCKNHH